MGIAQLCSCLSMALIVTIALRHRRMLRAISRFPQNRARLSKYPSVTIVRPIRGLDVGAENNLRATFDTDYPGEIETLFVLDGKEDPAYPLVVELIERHRASGGRGRVELLLAGLPPEGRTGKLNAMVVGARYARGDLIAFSDSDTCPDRQLIRKLVEALMSTPDAGVTFAPVVVKAQPRAAGDVGYAMLINAWYGPSAALAAGESGDLPFIMGQLMVFHRETLRLIGGLECADGQLVDDMYIGQCVVRAGLRNVMIRDPLVIVTGGMGYLEFIQMFRRWLLFARNGLPRTFTAYNWMRGLEFYAGLLLTTGAFHFGGVLYAVLPILTIIASVSGALQLQRRFGGAPIPLRFLWAAAAVPLVAPGILVSMWVSRRVNWRGRTYSVDESARLAPPVHAAAPPSRVSDL
jgi:ceramide glucosyltransferase